MLRALVAHGGKLVDTWPRNADNDAGFGRVASSPEFRDKLFVTTKIDQVGKDAGIAQFRDTQRNYQRQKLDLVQIFSLTDLDAHWPSLKDWKAAGAARYIGVTVSRRRGTRDLEQFSAAREAGLRADELLDHRAAHVEDRLLPFAADRGRRRAHQSAVHERQPISSGSRAGRCPSGPRSSAARRGRSSR